MNGGDLCMITTSDLNIQAQKRATNQILDEMGEHLTYDQLMELNKVLNKELNSYNLIQMNPDILEEDVDTENRLMIKNYLDAKTVEGLSKRSLYSYKSELQRFFKATPYLYSKITVDHVRDYLIKGKKENNQNNTTVNNKRKILSGFFKFLSNNGYIARNPMSNIRKIKEEIKIKKAFTSYELEKLRSNTRTVRDRAIFELLLSSGIRVSELCSLNKDDMDLTNMTFIVNGKGDKERRCYFNSTCKVYLEQYLMERGKNRKDKSAALFVSENKPYERLEKWGVERRIRELGRNSGIENVHPHKFRRTCATMLLKRGMSINEVQKVLGHESITTTMIYIDMDQDTVKRVHEKYLN